MASTRRVAPAPWVAPAPTSIPSADLYATFFGSLSQSGWMGGDGTNSVALPDGREAWIFSDTATGVAGASLRFVHNSIVVTGAAARPQVIPNPLPTQADGSYFWPAAGRVTGQRLMVLALHMVNTGSGLWDFRSVDTWLGQLDATTFRLISLRSVPGTSDGVSWGLAQFDSGAYTYIYGVETTGSGLTSQTFLHIARVPTGRLDLAWSFFTGSDWSANPAMSARVPVDGGDSALSNALSVFTVGGSVRMTSQQFMFGSQVYSWRASGPTGPFTGQRVIFDTASLWPTTYIRGTYTYNALAHPELTADGQMLFSFNVNSFTMLSPATIRLYRPRFFRVALGAL